MRFGHLVLLFGLVFFAGAAQAGCQNYGEDTSRPAPQFEICYGDVCDITAISYECANQYDVLVGFEIGWSMECDVQEGGCDVYWQGRPLDPAKVANITCRPLEADGVCNFP